MVKNSTKNQVHQLIQVNVQDFNTLLVPETVQSTGILRLRDTQIRWGVSSGINNCSASLEHGLDQACPLLFIPFLRLSLSYGHFSCISFLEFYRQLSAFSLCFFLSYFCPTGPFSYISLYESLLQPWRNPLCLTGLKAPTN